MGLRLKVEEESRGIHDWRSLTKSELSEDTLSKGPIASILLILPHSFFMMTFLEYFLKKYNSRLNIFLFNFYDGVQYYWEE